MRAGLSQAVASRLAGLREEDVPAATVEATKRTLLDGLGVMLAATTLAPACAPFTALARAAGSGPCTLLGRSATASPSMAALANGALSHALDFEDAHDGAPVHPNAVAIPAALAWAEAAGGVSGARFLLALAAGCDLTCRMGLALRADPGARGWYPPPMLGAFGAAAACGVLAGLDAHGFTDAFSLLLCSSTCSGEIKHSPDSDLRAVRDAFPAQAAVQAVVLAQAGVTGFPTPLEGRAGFFAQLVDGALDEARLLDKLGQRFEGENLTIKPWPCCRGTHAAIEGALALRAAEPDLAGRVVAIELAGHPAMAMLDAPHESKRAPTTAIDAKFSLPFAAATALVAGEVTLDSFGRQALVDAEVLRVAALASFRPLTDAPTLAAGAIRLRLADGTTRERTVIEPRGAPANPIGPAELVAKFRACAARAEALPSAGWADALVERVGRLETIADMRQLLAAA